MADKFTSIDEYIEAQSVENQEILKKIRSLLKETIPDGVEALSYGIPAIKTSKVLVMYAGFKKHIGLYPTPSGVTHFLDKLTDYETAKGSIKFPVSKPIPYDLIKEITLYRYEEEK